VSAAGAVLYGVSAAAWLLAAVFAFLYFQRFFADNVPPLEWGAVFAGLAVMAAGALYRAVVVAGGGVPATGVLVVELLGSGCLCVSAFMLWNKVRL
jgi:hypothetical protein